MDNSQVSSILYSSNESDQIDNSSPDRNMKKYFQSGAGKEKTKTKNNVESDPSLNFLNGLNKLKSQGLPERFAQCLKVKEGLTTKRFSLIMDSELEENDQKIHFEGLFFERHPIYFNKNCVFITKANNSSAVEPYPFVSDVIDTVISRTKIKKEEIEAIVLSTNENSTFKPFLRKLGARNRNDRFIRKLIRFSKAEREYYFRSTGMMASPLKSVAKKLSKRISEIIFDTQKDVLIALLD